MESTIFERIDRIIEEYGLNDLQFSEKTGIKQSTFSKGRSRGSDLKYMTIVKILTAFPEVSTEWFVMGKGEMKKDEAGDNWEVTHFIPVNNDELVEALRENIVLLRENNAMLKEKVRSLEAEKNNGSRYQYIAADADEK